MSGTLPHPVFLVLTAPSGAGKSTLIRRLREEFACFTYSVSCTTRAPRGQERDGEAYHFLTDAEDYDFSQEEYDGLFLSNGPGDPDAVAETYEQVRALIAKEPEDSLLRRAFFDVFIDVPSLDELRRRLVKRAEDAPEVIEQRLNNAAGERAHRHEFAAIVVNDDLDRAYRELRTLLLEKASR